MINPTTTVEEALSEAIALTLSVSSILGALTTSDEEHACLYALEEDVERTDRESYLEWRAREREVKDALGGGHV
ncbi:hypothetical protein [Pseudomonas aeruginosa]|uniref:hypothetical protein n=1 Tax=Pseudomonas aeruginosa TaxID=287 RepID=UPI001C865753|nr:hypothetical protein [Pseudomonas aeruginosa]QZD67880.1 hypothetical protein K3176_22575 [Pseudomonas aeruginosa]QZH54112.1 hypothetical protein K5A80_22680 [Pseudomonas aeruginosa]HEB0591895.1 hypothetical protein [Pseudomonas aeruginosa]